MKLLNNEKDEKITKKKNYFTEIDIVILHLWLSNDLFGVVFTEQQRRFVESYKKKHKKEGSLFSRLDETLNEGGPTLDEINKSASREASPRGLL